MARRPDDRDPGRLASNVRWAMKNAFEAGDLVPMVEALSRASARGSPDWVFAQRQLAELVVEKQPWRAAAAARQAARHAPDDCAAHALLGLASTLLGHYRLAARAYREALALSPDNPWYAHNLGHLLDFALDRPREAVRWLERAHAAQPHVEIAASLAHALGRTGRAAEGAKLLRRALGNDAPTSDIELLLAWLGEGAPTRARSPARAPREPR
jgi:Flp pilus assembly protein TadD